MLTLPVRRETRAGENFSKWRHRKNMALLRDCIFKRGPSPVELWKLETQKFNLKALNKVTIKFDPFAENVSHIRRVANALHESTVFSKNQKCLIKTEVVNDRSEQMLTAEAINGEKFIFKCGNLTGLEILRLLNKYVTPLAPPEEELTTASKVTKAMRN